MRFLEEMVELRKRGLLDVRIAAKQFLEDHYYADRARLSEVLKKRDRIGVIAELKGRSPFDEMNEEMGTINDKYESHNVMEPTIEGIGEIANQMLLGGASAISVITEPKYFSGSYGNLQQICLAVPKEVPVIMKDIIIDSSQIELGVFCGASNGLIIPKICDPITTAKVMVKYGLEPLIEVHDLEDLRMIEALKGAKMGFVIAINNWDLRTFKLDSKASIKMVPEIRRVFGSRQLIIAEGGINSRQDIIEMGRAGIKAALVGSSLMRGDRMIGEKIEELLGYRKPFIKIGGITDERLFSLGNAIGNGSSSAIGNGNSSAIGNGSSSAIGNGECRDFWQNINAYGVVVGDPSNRSNVSVEKARQIFENCPLYLLRTLVTKNKSLKDIINYNEVLKPDLIQCNLKEIENNPRSVPRKVAMKLLHTIALSEVRWERAIKIIRSIPKQVFGVILDISSGNGKGCDSEEISKVIEACGSVRIILTGDISADRLVDLYLIYRPFGLDLSIMARSVEHDEIIDVKSLTKILVLLQKLKEAR